MKNLYALIFALTLFTYTAFSQTPCSLDPTWDGDGKLVADGSRLGDELLLLPDGKLLVACNPFGDTYAYLRRFNTDGTVDMSFGTSGQFILQVAERRTDIAGMALHNGVVYITGSTTTDIGGTNTYVYAAAITTNGAYVNSFGLGGVKKFNSGLSDFYIAGDIGVDANGGIYMAGLEWLDNLFVVKMDATGAIDATWDGDGMSFASTGTNGVWWEVGDLAFDKNNQVVLTGKKYANSPGFWSVFIARFNANGSLDNSFATNGIGLYNSAPGNFDEAKSIMVTPSNNYCVAGILYNGNDYDYSAARILHDGSLDATFGTNGWSINDLTYNQETENCLNATMLPDGRILQTGNQGSGDTVHFALLMLTPNGQRDNVFAPNGVFLNIFNQNNNSSSHGMAVDATGKIYLGGYTRTCANGTCGPLYMAISRYNNTFGQTTTVNAATTSAVKIYPNPATAGSKLEIEGVAPEVVESIQWMDANGKVIGNEGNGFRVPNIAQGLYFMHIRTAEATITEKIIVE
jgi:uncharacterized delta-60 repeat protein